MDYEIVPWKYINYNKSEYTNLDESRNNSNLNKFILKTKYSAKTGTQIFG